MKPITLDKQSDEAKTNEELQKVNNTILLQILLRLKNAKEYHKSNDTEDIKKLIQEIIEFFNDLKKNNLGLKKTLEKIHKMVSTNANEIDNVKELLKSQNLIIKKTEQISKEILNLLNNMNENFENYLNVQNLIEIINKQGEKIGKILVFIENHKRFKVCENPDPPKPDPPNSEPPKPDIKYSIKPIFTRYLSCHYYYYLLRRLDRKALK